MRTVEISRNERGVWFAVDMRTGVKSVGSATVRFAVANVGFKLGVDTLLWALQVRLAAADEESAAALKVAA